MGTLWAQQIKMAGELAADGWTGSCCAGSGGAGAVEQGWAGRLIHRYLFSSSKDLGSIRMYFTI